MNGNSEMERTGRLYYQKEDEDGKKGEKIERNNRRIQLGKEILNETRKKGGRNIEGKGKEK